MFCGSSGRLGREELGGAGRGVREWPDLNGGMV
jgi:hypothetical protein